jgi:hypothetical protein
MREKSKMIAMFHELSTSISLHKTLFLFNDKYDYKPLLTHLDHNEFPYCLNDVRNRYTRVYILHSSDIDKHYVEIEMMMDEFTLIFTDIPDSPILQKARCPNIIFMPL